MDFRFTDKFFSPVHMSVAAIMETRKNYLGEILRLGQKVSLIEENNQSQSLLSPHIKEIHTGRGRIKIFTIECQVFMLAIKLIRFS